MSHLVREGLLHKVSIGEDDGRDCIRKNYWDLRLEKLSKSLSKIMIAEEGVESKHSTSWKHQEWMISSSILGDPII